ncbi:hypothetical protein ABK040_013839 [Willaertia magna]
MDTNKNVRNINTERPVFKQPSPEDYPPKENIVQKALGDDFNANTQSDKPRDLVDYFVDAGNQIYDDSVNDSVKEMVDDKSLKK